MQLRGPEYTDSQEFPIDLFTRRDVIAMLASALAIMSAPGCGGGGGGQSPPTRDFAALLTQDEVGGAGLRLLASPSGFTAVQSGRIITAQVAADAAQVVAIADAADKIRALAVTVPGDTAGAQPAVGAASTADALVFITPGVLSTDPGEARLRLQQIRALPSHGKLAEALRTRLPASPLADVVRVAAVADLVSACVSEWTTANGRARRLIHIGQPDYKGDFGVKERSFSDPSAAKLDLTNAGWRCVNVVRRDTRIGVERPLVHVADGLTTMGGAKPASWGGLFHTGEPTSITNSIDMGPSSGASMAEYWVFGPGWASATDTPNGSIANLNLVDAWGISIVWYVTFPLIDVVLGGAQMLGRDFRLAAEIWEGIKDQVSMVRLFEAKTLPEAAGELADLAISIIQQTLEFGLLDFLGQPAVVLLKAAFLAGGLVMVGANVLVAAGTWFTEPRVMAFPMVATGSGDVVIRSVSVGMEVAR